MAFPRSYHNLTILPDGSVLATGGGQSTDPFDQDHAGISCRAVVNSYRELDHYGVHDGSATVSLDCAIVTRCPCLDRGWRPVRWWAQRMTCSMPKFIRHPICSEGVGRLSHRRRTWFRIIRVFLLTTPDSTRIATVSLLPLGSVTHHFNANQRYLNLSFQPNANGLSIQSPSNANIAPPGYYMLFIVDTNGVPSMAATLRIQ